MTNPTTPETTILPRTETWEPHEVKRLMKAGRYCASKNVALVLGCLACGEKLVATELRGGKAARVVCKCVERVWA